MHSDLCIGSYVRISTILNNLLNKFLRLRLHKIHMLAIALIQKKACMVSTYNFNGAKLSEDRHWQDLHLNNGFLCQFQDLPRKNLNYFLK